MEQITTIGLDLAKHVFQSHGVDGAGKVLVRTQLRRAAVLLFCDAAIRHCPKLLKGATLALKIAGNLVNVG
jgi:hypothetical protein